MSDLVPSTIRVMIVDDHPMLRDGLSALIRTDARLELVGDAENGREALEKYRALHPDITLMDLQMPVMNGVAAVRAIRKEFADAKIIVLTMFSGDALAVDALKAGAGGYLLKNCRGADLFTAIDTVRRGARYLHPEIAGEIAAHLGKETLKDRELRTLELVAEGKSNKEIAADMNISEETVKANLREIFVKLDVKDRTLAVMVAIRRGMIGI